MFNFICKTLPYWRPSVRTCPTHALFSLQYNPLSSSTLKSITNFSSKDSFKISYLINSCGLPREKALSASNYINFGTPEKPDSVLAFFQNHGFTKTQISNVIRMTPRVLLLDPQKILLPKVEFLNSIGVSSTDLTKIITSNPNILMSSLKNQIIPSFIFLESLLHSREQIITAIKRYAGLLCYDLQAYVTPNIEILRELSVPEMNIVAALGRHPRMFMIGTDRFGMIVEEVKKMGFNPLTMKFFVAIYSLAGMSKLTWKKKVELYKKWGWSDDEISLAFWKYPLCMAASEDKITRVMDFLVNKMGWESYVVARLPVLICLSLERRIVPRCAIYQVLLAKGLIKKESGFIQLFMYSEKQFLNKITKCYEEEGPELLKLYLEKLDLSK